MNRSQLSRYLLINILFLASHRSLRSTQCSPIAFGANSQPILAMPPSTYPTAAFGAGPGFMLMDGSFNRFASMHSPYFMPAATYEAPWGQFDVAGRRSLPALFGPAAATNKGQRSSNANRERGQQSDEPSDEQKALEGLPLSFIEPDPPSTITERLSESFSALGEGVKNHFRSMSENFSDTMDDIRDAWRPAAANSETTRKRRS